MMKVFLYKLRTYGLSRILQFIPYEVNYLFRRFLFGSYSQRGEDLIIQKLFPRNYKGFYVDCGANDPFRFNNTCLFYKRGWRGINIEPDLENYSKINKVRTKDINLNIGIGESEGQLSYYRFLPHTLNTFSKEEADSCVSQGYKLLEIKLVPVMRLENVLEKYIPSGMQIDFISIDTEGFDLIVLNSMNISKFLPKIILIEHNKNSTSGVTTLNPVKELLELHGYSEIYTNGVNTMYSIL